MGLSLRKAPFFFCIQHSLHTLPIYFRPIFGRFGTKLKLHVVERVYFCIASLGEVTPKSELKVKVFHGFDKGKGPTVWWGLSCFLTHQPQKSGTGAGVYSIMRRRIPCHLQGSPVVLYIRSENRALGGRGSAGSPSGTWASRVAGSCHRSQVWWQELRSG